MKRTKYCGDVKKEGKEGPDKKINKKCFTLIID